MSNNNNITYTLTESGYYIPNLAVPEWKPIGKYGSLHLSFIKEHKRSLYSTLMLTGTLNEYLVAINEQANEMYRVLMPKYMAVHSITQQLKAENQLKWVQEMNFINSQINEIIYEEVIFE